MARARCWILADPHAGADAEADAALTALLDQAGRSVERLLILGDLCLAWVGRERFWTPAQRALVERLRGLRAGGVRVELVPGNRDYFTEALAGDVFDQVYGAEALLELAGRPTWVAHGDLVNEEDLPYRTWRALSRGAPARALAAVLPGSVGRALVGRLEEELAETNARYKTGVLPVGALEALSRRARRGGAERVLLGHFHHDRVLAVPGGVPVVLAPAWLESRRVLVGTPAGELLSTPARALAG